MVGNSANEKISTAEAGLTGLERAKRMIDSQPELALDLRTLARAANCSPFHFLRSFRLRYHQTPHHYQVRRRIERAKVLLAESDLRITDICFEVGFESLGSFSSRFREITGWPPSVYRARSLEQKREPRRFIPHCYIHQFKLEPSRSQRPS